MDDYFKAALHNFTMDVACADAIRHLADKGMSVREIYENLTYPAKITYISRVVWEHYVSSGKILLEKPADGRSEVKETSYVIDHDRFGHKSYRKVTRTVSDGPKDYVRCDFGKRIYRDREVFEKELEALDKSDREYVLGLPWPLEDVYHINDEQFRRIMKALQEKKD